MKNKTKIAITTGGTGGHVFPAKALANTFDVKEYDITILLDSRAYKHNYDWNKDYTIKKIYSLGLHKKSLLFILKILFFMGLGIIQSLCYFIFNRPKVLVSFGGYSSVPTAVAAIILRIPIILHEQNALLGKAHKLIAKGAKVVALTFPDTSNIPQNVTTEVVGLPIREEFYQSQQDNSQQDGLQIDTKDNKLVILILGGSQGAKIFGKVIVEAFLLWQEEEKKDIMVYHQCRQELIGEVEKLWQQSNIEYEIKPFFYNMATIMQKSDFIIARSGSSTIAEINALQKKALYIPFAKAALNHQEKNAQNAKKYNGAFVMLEKDFNAEVLGDFLQQNKEKLKSKAFLNKGDSNNKGSNNQKVTKSSELLKELILKYVK